MFLPDDILRDFVAKKEVFASPRWDYVMLAKCAFAHSAQGRSQCRTLLKMSRPSFQQVLDFWTSLSEIRALQLVVDAANNAEIQFEAFCAILEILTIHG